MPEAVIDWHCKRCFDGTWSLQANVKGNVVHSFTETSIDLAGNSASSAGVTLYTPAANKVLRGGDGNDVLIGAPNHTLTGGPGADTLVFNPSFGKETVRITTSIKTCLRLITPCSRMTLPHRC